MHISPVFAVVHACIYVNKTTDFFSAYSERSKCAKLQNKTVTYAKVSVQTSDYLDPRSCAYILSAVTDSIVSCLCDSSVVDASRTRARHHFKADAQTSTRRCCDATHPVESLAAAAAAHSLTSSSASSFASQLSSLHPQPQLRCTVCHTQRSSGALADAARHATVAQSKPSPDKLLQTSSPKAHASRPLLHLILTCQWYGVDDHGATYRFSAQQSAAVRGRLLRSSLRHRQSSATTFYAPLLTTPST